MQNICPLTSTQKMFVIDSLFICSCYIIRLAISLSLVHLRLFFWKVLVNHVCFLSGFYIHLNTPVIHMLFFWDYYVWLVSTIFRQAVISEAFISSLDSFSYKSHLFSLSSFSSQLLSAWEHWGDPVIFYPDIPSICWEGCNRTFFVVSLLQMLPEDKNTSKSFFIHAGSPSPVTNQSWNVKGQPDSPSQRFRVSGYSSSWVPYGIRWNHDGMHTTLDFSSSFFLPVFAQALIYRKHNILMSSL